MIQRALISVSAKEGIEELAKRLQRKGIEIIATGGTAKLLKTAGIPVTLIEDITGFPECFAGRVKTMHPMIMGGILFRRSDPAHCKEAETLGIKPIDLVVVNLYPFDPTSLKLRGAGEEEYIELIDIGGPTLLRSAAKNHESVTVVCDPEDYDRVLQEIEKKGNTIPELRRELAAKVFFRTSAYDALIAEWLSEGEYHGLLLSGGKKLRYGENPHQWGKVYRTMENEKLRIENAKVGVAGAEVLQGKEMSYLNYLDSDAAWQCVLEFKDPTVVFLKHASPCGVATNSDILTAFRRGYDSDPRSAFGVIIALNRECTGEIVREILDRKIFTELLLAPNFTEEAVQLLRTKPNIRVLKVSDGEVLESAELRSISGGVLMQSWDRSRIQKNDVHVVTKKKPSEEQLSDLLFAWKVVKHVKSNAIVFAHDGVTVGIGPGQTSRVDATEIATRKAGPKAKGAVMASDAFFPFPDSIEEAARHGISAIIQPGGSVRDSDVIAKADELGIAMVLTGIRAFRH